jgi:acyl carrier protein
MNKAEIEALRELEKVKEVKELDEIQETICQVLQEMGFLIFDNTEEGDMNLQNYVVDSLQFVDFIVRLEDKFHITFPDEFLDYNVLLSWNGLGVMIQEFLESKS